MKGVVNQSELLVTDTERLAKLQDILGSRFVHSGELLLPTFRQYDDLETEAGLLALTKDMLRWLGYKPHRLHVSYVEQDALYAITHETISISAKFHDHPLVTGGILACAVIQFVSEHHHFLPDTRFVERATVETGFGLWIINALQPKRSYAEKLYHMLDGAWAQLEGLQLQAMSTSEYLQVFTAFTAEHRLFPEEYGRSVSKRSLHVLPNTASNTKIIPMVEPSATLAHLRNTRLLWLRITLLALTTSAIITFGVIFWSHRDTSSYDQSRDVSSLSVIKQSLNQCIQKASNEQSSYDPNDLFMARQIDATKARCESLRNQYNDALSSYETNYHQ